MRTNRRIATLLCVTLALSACGGDDDDTASDPADEAAEPADSEPADEAPAGEEATITIADFAFEGVTEVAVGTTVVVTNTDDTQHTWTALDGTFDSSALGPGDTFEFTFTEAGTYDYQCNFHPSMTGTIVVTG